VKFEDIRRSLSTKSVSGETGIQVDIKSIHYRAQDIKPGGLFVAIPGHAVDGHDYIDEALDRGASVILAQKPVSLNRNRKGTIVVVENTRAALSEIAARFYGNPTQKLHIVGITGTNGKTTTAYLLESILNAAGTTVGVIGTINYRYGGKTFANPVTTPESLDLQRIMAEMISEGVTHAVLEVSSHALDLFRVAHCWLDVGIFTNLSQDHLDYHGDINSYWLCKQRMFTEHMRKGPKADRAQAVINCADPRGKALVEKLTVPVVTFGDHVTHEIHAKAVVQDLNGLSGTIASPKGEFDFKSSIVGKHNVENILGATGAGIAMGIPLAQIQNGIESLQKVPGRLEQIANLTGRNIFVDYAHTPDALENVLTALSVLADGRIICIFGCGGDRDKEKRPQMGEIAGRLSDLAIITSDNPRSEPPMDIIAQIRDGISKSSPKRYAPDELESGCREKGYSLIPDRSTAICLGIRISQPGDAVLIAGKGHETYQIVGDTTIPFDDCLEAQKALDQLKAHKQEIAE
jgi:UDP-N-acetylmuramoyl-L-alanyl-D-glutamate--2,6-diaminopimelate ligase